MPDLIPVPDDVDPFNPRVNLVPVNNNPFALQGNVDAAIQQQNAIEAQRRATAGGLLQHFMTPGQVSQGVQPETPGVMTEADAYRLNQLEDQARNWAPQQAMNMIGTGVPMAQAGALGTAGGGIKAYHGSPHDFDAFDLSKIGTGEGAQAYGHGLYFAQEPAVAQQYRDKLSGTSPIAKLPPNATNFFVDEATKGRASGRTQDEVLATIKRQFRHANQDEIQASVDHVFSPPSLGRMYEVNINADPEHFLDWDKPLSEQPEKVRRAVFEAGGTHPQGLPYGEMRDAYLKPIERALSGTQPGRFVKPDDILSGNADMGAIKEALANEPERLRAIESAKNAYDERDLKYENQDWSHTGATSYSKMTESRIANPDLGFGVEADEPKEIVATRALHNAGIPGIKYLDQGSRDSGEGTSNYVVFNDKLIDIIKKYGLAGLVAGGASHFTTTPVNHNPFAAQQ